MTRRGVNSGFRSIACIFVPDKERLYPLETGIVNFTYIICTVISKNNYWQLLLNDSEKYYWIDV